MHQCESYGREETSSISQVSLNQQQPIMNDFQQHQTHHTFPAASNASAYAFPTPTNLDVREIVWSKLQVLKDKYLEDMKELYSILMQRSTTPMTPEKLQKIKHYKDVLQRMIPYLTVPKERVPQDFNENKVEAFEKQINNIMETFKRRKLTPLQQPGPLSQQQLHPNERLQSVQQEEAQQQRQQEMLQQHQQILQYQQEIQKNLWQLQQVQQEVQKNLWQQQQLFQQQQKELQEQQQQKDMIEAMTGCFSRLPLN